MLSEILKNNHIILASASPRRQQFFKELNVPFTVDVKPVNEVFPKELERENIVQYLAQLKANAFKNLKPKDILITADTIVWFENKVIEKPKNAEEAFKMIKKLSGNMHEVFSAVCFTSIQKQVTVCDTTQVWFKELEDQEIHYYVQNFNPFDKAGGYGIQEWIGLIGVTRIEGSYNTVMGLPTHLVYKTLIEFVNH